MSPMGELQAKLMLLLRKRASFHEATHPRSRQTSLHRVVLVGIGTSSPLNTLFWDLVQACSSPVPLEEGQSLALGRHSHTSHPSSLPRLVVRRGLG